MPVRNERVSGPRPTRSSPYASSTTTRTPWIEIFSSAGSRSGFCRSRRASSCWAKLVAGTQVRVTRNAVQALRITEPSQEPDLELALDQPGAPVVQVRERSGVRVVQRCEAPDVDEDPVELNP